MAGNEHVSLEAGLDVSKVEAGAKKMTQSVEREAKKAGAALGKFGFETDGVLTKLARQFSATDIAAGAVFATIAKSQQIVRDSLKAFEDYSRSISVVGDGVVTYSERLDEMARLIKENNAAIGAAISPFAQFGQTLEAAASTGMVAFLDKVREIGEEYRKNPFLRAAFMASGSLGMLAGQAVGVIGAAPQAGPQFARYGPDLPQDFYTSQIREQDAATKKATEDAMRSAERLFDNLVRQTMPNRGAIGGGGGMSFGLGDIQGPFGIGGPVSVPGPAYRTGPEYNEEALRAYEEAMEASRQFAKQFTDNIGTALSQVLFYGQDFKESIVTLFKQMFADILAQQISSGILGAIFPGAGATSALGAGRTAGVSVTPAQMALARYVAPGLRYETSRGRGV